MQGREIEIHDSTIDQVKLDGSTAILHFTAVYIYPVNNHMKGGWRQEAEIRIGNARIEGEFSEESRAAYGGEHVLADGHFRLNAAVIAIRFLFHSTFRVKWNSGWSVGAMKCAYLAILQR